MKSKNQGLAAKTRRDMKIKRHFMKSSPCRSMVVQGVASVGVTYL